MLCDNFNEQTVRINDKNITKTNITLVTCCIDIDILINVYMKAMERFFISYLYIYEFSNQKQTIAIFPTHEMAINLVYIINSTRVSNGTNKCMEKIIFAFTSIYLPSKSSEIPRTHDTRATSALQLRFITDMRIAKESIKL